MSPILVLLSICVSNLPFLPRPKVQCPGMQLPATATHNRIDHIYSTYTIHSCSIMAGGYCCVQTALLALSESNPSEKKKKQSWRRYNQRSGKQRFPCMHCHIWHEVPWEGAKTCFTWMREITWMLLLTGKGFVFNTIQVKSNSKLTITL